MRANNKETRRIHLGLVLAEIICVPAFVIELDRALGGNELSWAYVFEWPLLSAYAVYMWRKLLISAREENADATPFVESVPDDPKLVAWNNYLAQVHALDKADRSRQRPH